jgi:hypothetical protein
MKFVIVSCANPRWADEAKAAILCTAGFEGFPPIPFHATDSDPEPHGKALYARLVAGEFWVIAPYVPPTPKPTTGKTVSVGVIDP